ncbi:hypothetical protein F4782DRAFT_489441 [Xylaria castorea]|nr:hypothetical protein F4782DRAFT_489441 [Xylaria castorea]
MLANTDLPYMLAYFDETLRPYPPANDAFPCLVPKGHVITFCDEYLPQDSALLRYVSFFNSLNKAKKAHHGAVFG